MTRLRRLLCRLFGHRIVWLPAGGFEVRGCKRCGLRVLDVREAP